MFVYMNDTLNLFGKYVETWIFGAVSGQWSLGKTIWVLPYAMVADDTVAQEDVLFYYLSRNNPASHSFIQSVPPSLRPSLCPTVARPLTLPPPPPPPPPCPISHHPREYHGASKHEQINHLFNSFPVTVRSSVHPLSLVTHQQICRTYRLCVPPGICSPLSSWRHHPVHCRNKWHCCQCTLCMPGHAG